jgi:hypothetical protein
MLPRVSLCHFKGFSLSTSAKIAKIFTFMGIKNDRQLFSCRSPYLLILLFVKDYE